MDPLIKECMTQWVADILDGSVTANDIQSGKVLLGLASLVDDDCLGIGTQQAPESWKQIEAFLDGNYHFKASSLFSVKDVLENSADDEEAFGVCLLLLIACLQGRAKQLFMDAALNLDFDTQNVIFHLLREPMTQLSSDQQLTRESILTGFREPVPSPQSLAVQADTLSHPGASVHSSTTLVLPDKTEVLESTPIKAVSSHMGVRQSWCGSHDGKLLSVQSEPNSDALCRSWTASTYFNAVHDQLSAFAPEPILKTQPDNEVFRPPGPILPKKVSRTAVTFKEALDDDSYTGQSISGKIPDSLPDSSSPALQRRFLAPANTGSVDGGRRQRPGDLPIHRFSSSNNNLSYQCSLAPSVATSLGDLTDWSGVQKHQMQHPLPSPLASLKHLLDSPMWVQKTRLRETERERRRLLGELEKERNYRDEVENVVAELRTQLDEARLRATEAESRATRMSRDLAALQDQADELSVCRAELALRDDAIASLKQRLNSFQDLMSHSRKLELENSNLQQECADQKQKVEQLSAKLSEIKDRRMMCTEMETLRSKLSDVEAQLAQQILERESVEKDARRQQELYSQLKLQQSLAEKRRALNVRRTTVATCSPSTLSLPGQPNSVHSTIGSVNDIEFETSVLNSSRSAENGLAKIAGSGHDTKLLGQLRSGENLGSVLETDLRSAHSHISRLQAELSEALDQVSVREAQVEQLTDRVNQLTVDLSTLSMQRELSEETLKDVQATLANFQSDVATLEGRILWSRIIDEKANSNERLSPESLVRIQTLGLDQLRTVGTGLAEPLDKLCHLLVCRFEDVLRLQEQCTQTAFDQLAESQNAMKSLKDTVCSLDRQLTECQKRLEEQAEQHERFRDTQHSVVSSLEREKCLLQDQLTVKVASLEEFNERIRLLESEKTHLESLMTELKHQTDLELVSSKELLEKATQRLRELEVQLSTNDQTRAQLDACIQTNASLAELPMVITGSHLHESLEHLDMDLPPVATDDDLSPQCDVSNTAYEALAADRRGLSDELVRLHSALDEANEYAQRLEQQNNELVERLESTETALQQQTTLFTHAQENWAVTEGQLRNVRAKHSAELDSLRGELVPQINQLRASAATVANQMRVVQADNEDLQRRLCTTSSELEKMVAERNRLAERNADLQRELVTTRNLVETMARNQHQGLAADRSLHGRTGDASVSAVAARHSPHSHINGSVEEWVEAARIESARKQRYTNGVYTESVVPSSRYPPQHSDSSECLSSSSPDRRASVPNSHKCKSSMRKSVRSSKNRHSYHLCEELARLTNRTAMLESVALALTQQREQMAAQQKAEQMNGQRSSVPVASSTLCSTQQKPIPHSMSGGVCPTALSQSGPNPASAPVGYPDSRNSTSKHELDTDADSSAFTDLSKVSPVSKNDHVGLVASTLPHSSPVSANLSRLSSTQEPYKSDPGQSTRIPRTRVESDAVRFPTTRSDGLQSNGLQDSRTSPRKTAQDQKDSDLLDPDRINELHRRNRLQPLHLRTSYPVETQCVEPEQVAGALSHLASTGQSKGPFLLSKPKQTFRKPSTTNVLGTVPEDHRTVLREVDEDNLLKATHRNSIPGSSQPPNRLKLQEMVSSSKADSPVAAGYQPIPRNIQAITDALIAASYDPSAMAEALSAEISKASLTARNSSRSGDTSQSTVRTHSAKPGMHLESSDLNVVSRRVIQSTDLTRPTSSPSKQSHFIDENTNPPILSIPVTGNMTSSADRFVRPSAPCRARGHQHNSDGDSEDSLSVASSIRSNKSSIAFEIPNEQATVKVRRLPASRRPPSSTTPRRGAEGKRKPQPPIALSCAKLPLGPPVSSDDNSFPVVETPIQRNTRYLNETSGVCR
ncbi:hypothetical protein CRM22_007192 [Opisthorchis felineus]|uniref:Uncharacterized protein n=1 Tax=Opisthorchis felineus TaxID=147828 RepID=A0A4S2LH80_OPIFE|nr:hypothetical protein CRM22_007192 [Opisthorchis felineus]